MASRVVNVENFELILKNEFLDEAAQSLTDTEQCFLLLENDPNNLDNLNKIFRLAHNLKGSSKAVGFLDMSAFTHEFETFILKLKNGELSFNTEIISLMLICNDHLIKMVDSLKQDHSAQIDSAEILEKIQMLKNAKQVAEEDKNLVEIASVEVVEQTHEPVVAVDEVIEIEPNLELLRELMGQLPDVVKPEAEKLFPKDELAVSSVQPQVQPQVQYQVQPQPASQSQTKNNGPEESIRISVSKLEGLLNYVGEMVILQSVLREQVQLTESMLLKKTIQQLGKVGKEIQDLSMSLRMVPIKPTFQKMQRIVRDTAMAVKKDVTIQLVGEDTELDKTVLEKINDPLVHLIRNSVDHGIELPEIRLKNGKPAKGLVTLVAYQRSGKLIIEVKDDGAGLNPEKLKNKAIEKGILKSGTQLSEKDAYNLIFAPGFSTKELVTDVSGRGVGMDVVKTNIHELAGEVQIFSELGKGTTFQITLPLSLAIIDGMVVSFAKDKFVIPLSQVYETLRPTSQQLHHNQGLGQVLMLRGENLPIFRLGDFFNHQSHLATTDMIALVIRSATKPFAILVDDILGQFQVVIKKLGPELQSMKGVSGSTILGDGKPALIVEPNELLKRTRSPLGQKIQSSTGGKVA